MTGKDKQLVYLELPRVFPDKAGKLRQVIETQKRIMLRMSTRRDLTDEAKALMISVAEGYDVAMDLLDWMKTTVQEIANDASTLAQGAKMRDIIAEQAQLIEAYMDHEIAELKKRRL